MTANTEVAVSTAEQTPVATTIPELELNLPQQAPICDCPVAEEDKDYTFLEKGYRALLDGEYTEAMDYFLRYQRLESSPRAQLEAGIAITYVQMLPRSNFYNPEVARSSFNVLRKQNAKALGVHDYTRLMRQSLINFVIIQNQLDELRSRNQGLQEELSKREEALKKLRDLTLGQ
ncbi:MAG: hypothetical protein AAGF57_00470 [Pseudomonadota bacterium]